MAIDNKYGRVSFEEPNTIGEDEPVVVFRAADPTLPEVLRHARDVAEAQGSPDRHLAALETTRSKVVDWQIEHPELVREKPTSSNWDGVNRV